MIDSKAICQDVYLPNIVSISNRIASRHIGIAPAPRRKRKPASRPRPAARLADWIAPICPPISLVASAVWLFVHGRDDRAMAHPTPSRIPKRVRSNGRHRELHRRKTRRQVTLQKADLESVRGTYRMFCTFIEKGAVFTACSPENGARQTSAGRQAPPRVCRFR